MKEIQAKTEKKHPLLLAVCLLVLALSSVFLGVTLARYQRAGDTEVALTRASVQPSVHLLAFEEDKPLRETRWTAVDDVYTLPFRLTNWDDPESCAEQTQNVTLRVMTTAASVQQPPKIRLTIRTTEEYTATPELVAAGSVAEKQYGPGLLYRFYNAAGEELQWTLPGGQNAEIPMHLFVSGGAPYTAFTLLTVCTAESAPDTYLETGDLWRGNIAPGTEEADGEDDVEVLLAEDAAQEVTFYRADTGAELPVDDGDVVLLGTLNGEAKLTFFGIPEDAERSVEVSDPDWAIAEWTEDTLTIWSELQREVTVPAETEPEDPREEEPNTDGSQDGSDGGTDAPEADADAPETQSFIVSAAEDSASESIIEDADGSEEAPNVKVVTLEREEPVTVTASWETDDTRTTIEFIIEPQYADEETDGEIELAEPQYYDPQIPIVLYVLHNDVTLGLDDDVFPAGTRYTVSGQQYILSQEDVLRLPADEAVMLDLSRTEQEPWPELLRLTYDADEMALEYFELPVAAVDETPIVTGDDPLLLPMRYRWGEEEDPTVVLEQLDAESGEFVSTDSFFWEEDEETGFVRLNPNGAPAGTYRVQMVWEDKHTEYYRLEFPFYVFYQNGLDPQTSEDYQRVRLTE